MADFIKVSNREEAKRLAYQHYQDKGSLTDGNSYILPDGTKLRVRKRIPNVSGASDLKAEAFETKAKADVGRSTRIGSSKKVVNKAIRDEAAAQWDELVGDRNATINIGGKPYSFDKYLNKEVRDHSKFTRQKAVEAVNLGKSLGHGTPTTDVGRYAESYTQQFAETPTGNYATQDYIPPDQLERLQKAGLATSPQEAARLHVGTTKIGGRLPDVKIEELLKINASGNLTRAGSQGVQNIGGYLPIPIPTGSQLRQNALGMGLGAATEAITPESAYAAGKGDWRTAAVEGVKAAATGAITGGAIQAGLTNLMPRVAASLASGPVMPLVAGVGAALTLQDAAQAYRAGQSGRSIPLQKKVEQTQQDKRRQQDVAQFRAAMPGLASKNRMQADLSGRLSPQQIESFRAGGGNAAMMRDGLSVQQVIERGSSLRLKKIVNSTIRDQV